MAQYHIQLEKGEVGRYVILPGDPGRCEQISRSFDNPRFVAKNREFVTYTGTLLGEKVSVCSTGIGGPSTAIAVEELLRVGADTFIRVGTCGGMQENIIPGQLIIADSAIRAEGTSQEYLPLAFPAVATHEIVCALKESAEKLGTNYHIGTVQCKDSFYGQHEPLNQPIADTLLSNWNAWIRGGCLASEMESSTLFILGRIRKARTGTILLVCGNQTREGLGYEDKSYHDTQPAIDVAIEAIKQLIKNDK